MTNKPMLSVELRALLESISNGAYCKPYVMAELSALLDKQSCGACGGCDNGCKLDRESPPIEPAAQHQGEPVALYPRCTILKECNVKSSPASGARLDAS